MFDTPGEKIDILYISGSGRSGSTVLDQTMGQRLGAFSMGEVRHVWQRGILNNELCSCGKTFSDCFFWGRVKDSLLEDNPSKDWAKFPILLRNLCRRPAFIDWFSRFRNYSARSEIEGVNNLLVSLYGAIKDQSGSALLIDSSKNPFYAFRLQKTEQFRIHVIHLVRDPRAVAFSWGRKKSRMQLHGESYMPRISCTNSCLRWVFSNLVSHLLKYFVENYVFLRYEDFVASPEMCTEQILQVLQSSGVQTQSLTGGGGCYEAHAIAGNPSRFEFKTSVLQLDNRWQREMKRTDRFKVCLLTFPLLYWYKYLSKR